MNGIASEYCEGELESRSEKTACVAAKLSLEPLVFCSSASTGVTVLLCAVFFSLLIMFHKLLEERKNEVTFETNRRDRRYMQREVESGKVCSVFRDGKAVEIPVTGWSCHYISLRLL